MVPSPEQRSSPAPGPEDPRVRFAAERTLLAWIRTGLALMGFGFVVARFGLFLRELAAVNQTAAAHSPKLSLGIGTALVILGVCVNLLAAWEHARVLQRLNRREPYQAPGWSLGLIASVILALLGIGIVAYLLLVPL
jgi:putative membrane protein